MKGLDTTMSFMTALLIGVVVVVIVVSILSGQIGGLEEFVGSSIDLGFGGDSP